MPSSTSIRQVQNAVPTQCLGCATALYPAYARSAVSLCLLSGKRLPILLKAIVLEQTLLIHWVAPASQQAPVSVTLDTEKYSNTSTGMPLLMCRCSKPYQPDCRHMHGPAI